MLSFTRQLIIDRLHFLCPGKLLQTAFSVSHKQTHTLQSFTTLLLNSRVHLTCNDRDFSLEAECNQFDASVIATDKALFLYNKEKGKICHCKANTLERDIISIYSSLLLPSLSTRPSPRLMLWF